MRNPHLRQLLDALFGEHADVWQRFRQAPAAKYYHQAYLHGLLEHSLSVGQAVSVVSGIFPGIDRDVAVTGGLIHDIGKIEAYASDRFAIDLTDDGKLLGEIPLGYYLVRTHIERIAGFPAPLARAVLHIVLSHHGTHENGSPVIPCTREATVVHAIDNLGGKLGSFDRLEKGPAGGRVVVALRPRAVGLGLVRAGRGGTRRAARTGAAGRLRRANRRWARPFGGSSGPPWRADGLGQEGFRSPVRMSNARDHKLGIFMVALLAAASVRLDDIWYRRPMDAQLWPDWLIAVILAFSASVVLIGTRRLLESRAQISELARRTSALADAAWIVSRGGETSSLLGRVAEQACNILHVERATVCVRNREDPRLRRNRRPRRARRADRQAARRGRGDRRPGAGLRRARDRRRLPRLPGELRARPCADLRGRLRADPVRRRGARERSRSGPLTRLARSGARSSTRCGGLPTSAR